MKIGYVYASNEVMNDGKKIGYMYREQPEDSDDSGWRIFSGEESQEYADDPQNFKLYNASTIVAIDSGVAQYLGYEYPVAFERDDVTGEMVIVESDE